jgi:hypothetical protein
MSDTETMGDFYREWEAEKKRRREENLKEAEQQRDEGWTVHSEFHWSRVLCGDKLDYWPSRNKFRWRDKTHVGGNVKGFIRNREAECTNDC